jgi:hypothetical protein
MSQNQEQNQDQSELDNLDEETLMYMAVAEEMDSQARESSASGKPAKPIKPTPSEAFQNAFNIL